MQWCTVDSYFMVFMKGWSTCLLLLYYCWGVETTHTRKSVTAKESVPFSDVMLVPLQLRPLVFLFLFQLFLRMIGRKVWLQGRFKLFLQLLGYYLHFNMGKEKTFWKRRPFVAQLQPVDSTQQSAVHCTVGSLHLSLTSCVITTHLTTLPIF